MDKYLKIKNIGPSPSSSSSREKDAAEVVPVDPSPPKKRREEPDNIWTYFTKITDKEGRVSGKCIYCTKQYKLPTSTTSPLHHHLSTVHKELWTKFDEARKKREAEKKTAREGKTTTTQCTISEISERMKPWTTDDPRHQEMNRLVSEFLIKGYHPFSTVEEEGFVNLMRHCAPKYGMPSRNTFSRKHIPNLYDDLKTKKQCEFKADLPSLQSVSLTTDIWSAHKHSYLSLTGHYVDPTFKYKSFCLGNQKLCGSHTGTNIRAALEAKATEWGLNETVPVYTVTDNARNITAAVTGHSSWIARSCVLHTMQLAINDAKEEVVGFKSLCKKATSIVGHFKHSTAASDNLEKHQKECGEPVLCVIQDVETRWNSEYDMLERLVKIRKPLHKALEETDIDDLTKEEWKICETYLEVLAPLKEGTGVLGSNTFPTSSFVFPFLRGCESKLAKIINSSTNVRGVAFAKSLLKSLKSRFPLYQEDKVYVFSMILDPRFKTSLIPIEKRNHWKSNLVNEVIAIGVGGTCSTSEEDVPASSSTKVIRTSIWDDIQDLQSDAAPSTQKTDKLQVEEELNLYLGKSIEPEQTNPYEYWSKEGRHIFKLLERCARKYLPIPASEINSERQFSTAGLIVTDRRARLDPANVEMLIFLHENMKD